MYISIQYSVSTNSTALLSLKESFNVTVGPVNSLAASPDGTLLYVLTPNKVMLLYNNKYDMILYNYVTGFVKTDPKSQE